MAESLEEVAATEEYWPKSKEEYDLGKVIGVGSTATVNAAFCKSRKEKCAIKRIKIEDDKKKEQALNEIEAMKACNHENIVKLFTSFIVDEEFWLVTRLADGGSLQDIIHHKVKSENCNHGVFDEETVATVLKEVLMGLEHVHSNGLIHRDIKAANIFISKDGTVQIGDLGISARLPDGDDSSQPKLLYQYAGTQSWMAPEVMESHRGYEYKADIWSIGITAIQMVTGRVRFQCLPRCIAIKLTLDNKSPTLDTFCNTKCDYKIYGKSIRSMIAHCLQKSPVKRPTATKLLQHRFFTKAKDKKYVVETLTRWIPSLELKTETPGNVEPTISVDEKETLDLNENSSQKQSNLNLEVVDSPITLDLPRNPIFNTVQETLCLFLLISRPFAFPDFLLSELD